MLMRVLGTHLEIDANRHSVRCVRLVLIKSAVQTEEEIIEALHQTTIIMDTLWVLLVKCKLRKSLKK